ncbi:protein OXIDATIVE STRESS 3-like [Musa acuminata AAA Group]|uniref:protein OXIDATIVE STRESS 3-like n=1 Tax=Musa acuminata AAA Group TaxID=214697 RepID=UPI0031D184C0
MVEGLKQRCHGVYLRRDEDDEELFDSDPFSSNSDDEDETPSTPDPSSLSPHLNSDRPLYELPSLMEQLPIKRGLSKYYQGKSQSYTSLSVVSSIEDLPKKETAYRRKMKACRSYAGGMDASHKSAHSPGHCSKTISKKVVPRVTSCASLMSKSSSSSLLCSSKPPRIPVHKNPCPH